VSRVVVIGDVGGHPAELHVGLAIAGAVAEAAVRPDTVVIQVGDLVDRGPDSAGVLAAVGRFLDRSPDRWVQLVGNHEDQYLPGGVRFWPEPIGDDEVARLRSWWDDGRLGVAAAVRAAGGEEFLLTHAGLSVDVWRDLGRPGTAVEAAELLNQRPVELLRRGGLSDMDTAGAGPLWADASFDLYLPWLRLADEGGLVPFGQVHGHSTIVHFGRRSWRCPEDVRALATVDWESRRTRIEIGGRAFLGVDPKHGPTGAPAWRPLVLEGAHLIH
jgi:hypothetical protein